MITRTGPYWPLILLLALIKFLLPVFLQDPMYELQRDEFLYYEQGQHLAIGYLENPPLISWLGMISSWMGGSEVWIKLWPCLFGAGTLILTCLIAAEFGGKLFAQFMAGVGIISGAFLRVHYLFQPNFLDIFFWTLALYFLVRYINTKRTGFIYFLAISLAIGFWGKYSVIFVAAAIPVSLLLSPHRNLLVKKQTWLAVLLALLIVLPNIWWQYQHSWPVVHHMKELQETQLQFLDPADFLVDQFMILLPVAIIWISGLIWVAKNRAWRFLLFTYLLLIIFLLLGRGKSYYSLGIYPILLAAGGVAWEQWTRRAKWGRYVIASLIIVFGYMIQPLLLPIWKPAKLAAFYEKIGIKHTWEDLKEHPLPQDFADMLGWKEAAAKTEKFFDSLPGNEKSETLILGSHYGFAGGMKYYGRQPYFRDKVISTNGSFLLWLPDRPYFRNLIYVAKQKPEEDQELFRHFERMTVIDSVMEPYSRQYKNKIFYYEHINDTGLQIAGDAVRALKEQFKR